MEYFAVEMLEAAKRVVAGAQGAEIALTARKTFVMTQDEIDVVHYYAQARGIDNGDPVRRLIQEMAYAIVEGQDPLRHRFFPTPAAGLDLINEARLLGVTNKHLNSGLYPVKPGSKKSTSLATLQRYFEEGKAKRWSFQSGSANEKLIYRLRHLCEAHKRSSLFGAAKADKLETLIAAAVAAYP